MTITYNSDSNIITIEGGTSDSPLTLRVYIMKMYQIVGEYFIK